MVPDFIDEKKSGFLALSKNTMTRKCMILLLKRTQDSCSKSEAKRTLDLRQIHDEIQEVVKIAEIKYPREEGFWIAWLFDYST